MHRNSDYYINQMLIFPGLLLFYLMLIFPMVLELIYVKAILFGIVLYLISIYAVNKFEIYLHQDIFLWTLFLTSLSLLFVLKGFIAGAPGSLKQAQNYVLWPIIYIVTVAGASNLKTLQWLERVIVIATISISIYGLNLILSSIGIVPEFGYLNFLSNLTFTDYGSGVGLHEGYSQISIPALNSLPFLLPYIMATLFAFHPAEKGTKALRLSMWIAFVLGIGIALLSGRRALWVVIALTPIIILLLKSFQPEAHKGKQIKLMAKSIIVTILIIICTIIYVQSTTEISLTGSFERLSEGFNFGSYADEDSSLRRDQFKALIEGWEDHPLLGAGLGNYVPSCIRSNEMPWAYELYYIALLYQTGIIGLTAYCSGIFWIFYMGIKIIRRGGVLGQMMTSSLAGLLGILISSGTNPYLDRFDGIWTIFFPLILINYWLLNPIDNKLSRKLN
jgi:O-antigen ligase